MLIRDAELDFGQRRADVRIEDGLITAIAPRLQRARGEEETTAQGRALLPSLCDHHIHLLGTAAALASVDCSTAACGDADGLARALRAADTAREGAGWLRGVGYHDALFAGGGTALDRHWLDRVLPERPVRIQHRSGRLWILNSAALREIGVDPVAARPPLERDDQGAATGLLYDSDTWLRARLSVTRPCLRALSRQLWAMGVTAVTDCTHSNDAQDYGHFVEVQQQGELLQDLLVMGGTDLNRRLELGDRRIRVGARKFHLHDHALPEFGVFKAQIRAAHTVGRNVAIHCVSRVDLTFALAALSETGVRAGDRIEHASVAPPEAVEQMAKLGLIVVTQPALIAERGDDYLREVEPDDQAHLYRLASLQRAGIPLALSSDAPYAGIDPWRAMQAAVDRRTASGVVIGPQDAMTPEAAFDATAGDVGAPGRRRALGIGARADMLLLDTDWAGARSDLSRVRPVAVWHEGRTTIT
ncbi:amidohydrolase family protein [Algiphilus sp.]|uniref:amidohydrolase family protein n=1 Tax=Algiphilus sp. TaxID=1872431 RepID=UPI003B521BFE